MAEAPKVGLVLSGGGAKGAYQVGMLRAMHELGVRVDVVAGASIGALNGAVLVAAPDFKEGVARLEEMWRLLGERSPLRLNGPGLLRVLLLAGHSLKSRPWLEKLTGLAEGVPPELVARMPSAQRAAAEQFRERVIWLHEALADQQGLLSTDPLYKMMEHYLDPAGLAQGLPLHVSVFPSSPLPLTQLALAELGLRETPDSEFFHVQSLPVETQRKVLLASAAIPYLFGAQKIGGRTYADGGIGGAQKAQGNTPIRPLLDAGCRVVVVNHLSDGSLWSRHDFPDPAIIEVRPQRPVRRREWLLADERDMLLGFDAEHIESWIAQGYEDALVRLSRVKDALGARSALAQSESALRDSEKALESSESAMREAMSRLR